MRSPGQTRATRMYIYEHLAVSLRFGFQKLPVSVTVQVQNYINIGVDVFEYMLEYGAPTCGLCGSELRAGEQTCGEMAGRQKVVGALMGWVPSPGKRILISGDEVNASSSGHFPVRVDRPRAGRQSAGYLQDDLTATLILNSS